ncbi:MAG TPA: diguanylate cyclase, partial [Permianibacter sp.]|nr:diguanylate cyclase [Permianibacter sp.]
MANKLPADKDMLLDALRRSEARFRAIFENVDALSIQGYAPDGTVTYWNPASTKLYGYSQAEALGNSLYELIIPEPARDIVRRDVQWMFQHKQGVPAARLALQHKDGHLVHVYSSHTVVETEQHGATLFCLDIDVNELARIEQAFSEAEQRYRALFDGSADGVLVVKPTGDIIDANQAACTLFGANREQLLTLTPIALSPERQPSGEPSADAALRLIGAAMAGTAQVFEWRHRRLDGSEFDAEIHLGHLLLDGTPHVVGTVRDISARKQSEAHIEFLAHHDALTGLPNRTLLRDRFLQAKAQSERHGSSVALLFLDLDHFKLINDTLGHGAGDAVLQQLVTRLQGCVRDTDTICRQGGDEFLLLVPDVQQMAALDRICQCILQQLQQPLRLAEQELSLSGSIGIAVFPQDGDNFDLLLQRADMAMYAAKAAGRNKAHFYSASMQAAIDKRAKLDRRLRKALQQQEMQLHFQPQVDQDGRICGAEALLRWQPPGQPTISPAEFIPLAEDTGFIVQLGQFVLQEACQTLARWAHEPALAGLTLAVNLSARQFRERDFETELADTLRRTGCDPRRLKLELTESSVLENIEEAVNRMDRLR